MPLGKAISVWEIWCLVATSTHQQLGFTGPWFCMKTQTHQDKAAVPGEVLIGSLEKYRVVLVVLIQAQIASSFMLNRVLIRMILCHSSREMLGIPGNPRIPGKQLLQQEQRQKSPL